MTTILGRTRRTASTAILLALGVLAALGLAADRAEAAAFTVTVTTDGVGAA